MRENASDHAFQNPELGALKKPPAMSKEGYKWGCGRSPHPHLYIPFACWWLLCSVDSELIATSFVEVESLML
jgi:hypothetical protein